MAPHTTLSYPPHFDHRALSLRNLVLGYECGRVFSTGVGPGSPSRDKQIDCLCDSAGRLRRGGGMVGASSELQFGALRGVVAPKRQGALPRQVW